MCILKSIAKGHKGHLIHDVIINSVVYTSNHSDLTTIPNDHIHIKW